MVAISPACCKQCVIFSQIQAKPRSCILWRPWWWYTKGVFPIRRDLMAWKLHFLVQICQKRVSKTPLIQAGQVLIEFKMHGNMILLLISSNEGPCNWQLVLLQALVCYWRSDNLESYFFFLTSPKKRTKKWKNLTCPYYDRSSQIFFVCFFGE